MIIPAGYGQINYKMTGAGLPFGAQVTFGVKLDAASPTASGLAVLAGGWAEDSWLGLLADDVTLSSVLVKFGPNATGASAEVAVGTNGGQTGQSSAPNVAVLCKKVTASGGRKHRGRVYLPGVAEAEVEPGGLLLSTFPTAMDVQLLEFRDAFETADYPLVVLHNDATTPTLITELLCDSRVATQRRRLRP